MDPSALIFVALAVAWAVYLIPKALENHEESVRARTVDRFSHTMRVLARREPGRRDKAEAGEAGPAQERVEQKAKRQKGQKKPVQAQRGTGQKPPRTAAATAAARRRNVLGGILVALVTVAALAGFAVIDWVWTAVPGGVLVAWLVACRLMVRRERQSRTVVRRPRPQPQSAPVAPAALDPDTEEVAVVEAPLADPVPAPAAYAEPAATADGMWQPMSVPLPTYVTKPAVRRTVRTIDLDSTGVFSSARNDADSALAREAEQAARVQQDQPQRATGS